jgi:hypothetical protein
MDLKKLLLSEGQRTNTKKVLQKTNNIGKNPLRKIYENKQLIKEDTTNKKYELRISHNVTGAAILKFDLPSNLKITSSNGKITIGSGADKFTYDCGKKYFTYTGTRSGGGQSTYTNNELSKFIENKYCKTDVGGGNKPTIPTTNKTHYLKSETGKKITIPSGAKIIPNKEKTGVAIKITEGLNQWVFFKCAGGVYIKDKVVYTASDDVLKNRLLKGFCQNKPEETPERTPGSGGAPTIQSQTPTLIKQIQKTIGVAETGKLTDTEIQTIYDKLNPSAPSNTSDSNTSDNRALKNALSGSLDAKPFGFDNKNKIVSEEINRIKEMMGIVLNEQSTVSQPENTPTEKLQELLNSKFSAGLVVDGKMGPKTAQAIINALGKTTPPTPTPSSTNQTSSGTPSETKPTDNTSKEVKPEPLPTF